MEDFWIMGVLESYEDFQEVFFVLKVLIILNSIFCLCKLDELVSSLLYLFLSRLL